MARRIGFMLAPGNTDAHLKNWSLAWGDAIGPTLAPCNDLGNNTLGWSGRRGPELALGFGRQKLFRDIDDAARAAFGARTPAWAGDEVRDGIHRARDAWPAVTDDVPPAMRAALETHRGAVPLLAQVWPPS